MDREDDVEVEDDGRWSAATEQARLLVERGPIVVGASLQAVLTGFAFVFFALAAVQASLGSSLWGAITSGAGFAVAAIAWWRARRRGGLEPALPSGEPTPMALLHPEQRRALRSQLRGRTKPTHQSVELVRLLIERQRASSRNLWPTLAGFGITLLGSNITSPRLLLGGAICVVLVVIAVSVERSRWRRVSRAIAQVNASR